MAKSNVAAEALDNYKLACDSYAKQLDREIEDLKFQVPELQWDELSRRQRAADTGGSAPTPARPMLSIPKLDQPIQLVLNQERAAHLGVNIHPLSEDATDETAEVLQGLYRKIERDSRANIARSWAFERAVKSGRGAYRINTCYDESGGNPFDQKITIERILYQECVKFDPSAKEPDYSDGEWAFVTQWMPIQTFKRLYPKAKVSMADDFDIERTMTKIPEWVKGEGDQRAVQVAEYFKKVHKSKVMRLLSDGSIISDADPMPEGVVVVKEREIDDVSVMWYKLAPGGGDDGLQVLEEQEWNGSFIPLVPVIGRELQPFDSERRWVGVIGPAKDAQRLFNYAASTAVEITALEPKAPFIGAEGQFEGHEQKWQLANLRNFPYLEYKPQTLSGAPLPPPARTQIDVGRLGPSMALIQQADDFIQASTSTPDPALGNLNARDRSGKAIQALQGQADASTSHYMHNLSQVSMTYEAKVILDMIPRIYDRPGRIARTLDLEDNSKTVMLNAPFIKDQETGRPKRVDPSTVVPFAPRPVGMGGPQQPQPMQAPKPKVYDLRKGAYGVSVSVGKSWSSRLQEGADEIGQILQADPALMPMIGPVYFKFRDFPGSKEIAEILKKVRDKQFPGLDQKDGEAPDAQALQSQLQAAQQQVQMMQGQLQQAAKAIEMDQAKQAATLRKAQMDAEAKAQAEAVRAETEIRLEQIRADADMKLQTQQEQFELLKLQMEQRFQAMQAELDRQAAHEAQESAEREAAEHQKGEEAND